MSRFEIRRLLTVAFTASLSLVSFVNCTPSFSTLAPDKSITQSARRLASGPGSFVATAQSLFDPLVFNWQFYLNANPDLRPAGIVDENSARSHWQNYGLDEGRASAPNFSVREYLALNGDLVAAFGSNYSAAVDHYVQYGHNEGRTAISSCPGNYYVLSGANCVLQPGLFDLGLSVTTTYQGYEKTVFTMPLTSPLAMTGLIGTLSTNTSGTNPSETLFIYGYVPSGQCVPNGSHYYDDWSFFGQMPGAVVIGSFILKNLGGGAMTSSANIDFPAPLTASGCFFFVMDGGPSLGGSAPINSIANVSSLFLKYASSAGDSRPYPIGAGDEFCFGMPNGCQMASPSQGVVFAASTQIPTAGTMIALYGNVSHGAISVPAGPWSSRDYFYVDRGCQAFSPGNHGPGNYFDTIPANAVGLADVPLSGQGVNLQQTVNQPLNVPVNAGDCLVHLVQVNGAGQVDAENQVHALIQTGTGMAVQPPPPAPTPEPTPVPTPDPLQKTPVYRFYNPQTVEHFYTLNYQEGVQNAFSPEGVGFNVVSSSIPGTHLLYRCLIGYAGKHLVSSDPNCEGLSREGTYGAVYDTQVSGAVPLWRVQGPNNFDFLATTNPSEGAAIGYSPQGVLGYVIP